MTQVKARVLFVHTVCLVLQAELEELGKAEDRSKVEKFLSTGTPVPSITITINDVTLS